MKKILFPGFAAVVIVSAFTSCKKESRVADITHIIVLPPNAQSVIKSGNRFAFDFLHATVQQDGDKSNKLISPLSIYLALSMVYNGAGGATRDSIAKALEFSGIDINNLNTVCKSLIEQLPGEDNKVQFSIANSIWYSQNDFQPLPSFLNIVQNYYLATAQPLNFNNHAAANTINDWVAGKTNNKISKIIDHTSSNDLMYLINAIYFNGAWKYAFHTSETHNDNFYLPDGTTATVPFMKQKVTVNRYADSLLTMIELPYGGGKSYSMYIVLPANQQQPVTTFVSLINENILESAINKMDSMDLQLNIPKWEYSYTIDDMKPELSMLGMQITFGDGADFSTLYDSSQTKPHITKAIHKTYIKVNEEGTEAAAVTGISVGNTVSLPYEFNANHPFLYSIIERQTGAILFAGIVNDPSKN